MERCQHFSIRGYVAEMRQKDPKTCLLPFRNSDQFEPLSVPHFRDWRCESCIRNSGISSASPFQLNGDNDRQVSDNRVAANQPIEAALEDLSDERIALMALLSLNGGQQTAQPQDPESSENRAGRKKKTRKRRLDEIYDPAINT